eukprot:CAMPEP_0174263248 /NCGR_PEP_ID=MMETSP0439-20130205/17846_1 /TAXON_ID=0 /ORGANISM="Stereomyxa ramosa, Strain Chinc5" /LENGTH=115 /DNA_ID=CAMNT_0015348499 /DNA_START=82 /DNA_END=425 /DNA_ORIENTATION=+
MARIHLYEALEKLGERVLYFDTDSVIFKVNTQKNEQPSDFVEISNKLGEWTNELKPGDYITHFLSTGPKSYAYITKAGKRVVKMKGICMNKKNLEKATFENLKVLLQGVLEFCEA